MPWDILLIFFVLGVIVPWRGRARLKQLLAKPSVEPAERLSLYGSTIAFQWVAAPVLNPYTRVAVEMCPHAGRLRVVGYERAAPGELPTPVTHVCEIAPALAA